MNELKDKVLCEVIKARSRQAHIMVSSEISSVVHAIVGILSEVKGIIGNIALIDAYRAYYVSRGYLEYDSISLAKKLNVKSGELRKVVNELIEADWLEKAYYKDKDSGLGVTFLKLSERIESYLA